MDIQIYPKFDKYLSQHEADLVDNGVTVSKQFHVKSAVRQWLAVDQDLRLYTGLTECLACKLSIQNVCESFQYYDGITIPGEHFQGERMVSVQLVGL